MDRQMGEILRKQEQQEQKAYRSAEMLVDMMQSDFVNSTAVLSMLDQNAAHLPELFRLTDAPVWPFDGKSIPIRRSEPVSYTHLIKPKIPVIDHLRVFLQRRAHTVYRPAVKISLQPG